MPSSKNEDRAGSPPAPDATATEPGAGKQKNGTMRRALIGSGLAGLAGTLLSSAPARGHGEEEHLGPLGSATISFGAWMLPLDRHPNQSPIAANHHHLCPPEVKVRAGACVNFIIAGVHQILIYDDGTLPGDIDTSVLVAPTGPAPPPALIADLNRLIYRGLDPSISPRERVEVVHFDRPGTYLVACAVPRHFNDGMYGFIRVLP
jgi:hypothetical protein